MHPHSRVFRTHFGGPGFGAAQRTGRPPTQTEQQRSTIVGLLQLLPVLLLVFLTFFNGSSDPAFQLLRDAKYREKINTARLGVPFYVKGLSEFDAKYPPQSHSRLVVERQVSKSGPRVVCLFQVIFFVWVQLLLPDLLASCYLNCTLAAFIGAIAVQCHFSDP